MAEEEIGKAVNDIGDNALILHARLGNLSEIERIYEKLLKEGTSRDAIQDIFLGVNKYGKTPLHESAQFGRLEVVKFLLETVGIRPDCLKQGDW